MLGLKLNHVSKRGHKCPTPMILYIMQKTDRTVGLRSQIYTASDVNASDNYRGMNILSFPLKYMDLLHTGAYYS